MGKFTDAVKTALQNQFKDDDIPTEQGFADWIDAVQAGIQEHEHKSGGGPGSGTGDAAPITDLPNGADFHGQEAKNLVIHKGTSFPANPVQGQKFWRSDQKKLYLYTGSEWVDYDALLALPSGAICMFQSSCPEGWTRVTELDGKFPRGGETYGDTGGSTTHHHVVGNVDRSDRVIQRQDHAGTWVTYNFRPGLVSSDADHTPPYYEIVFCEKQ